MFAPASTNANVVKNFHSGKLNSCAAVDWRYAGVSARVCRLIE